MAAQQCLKPVPNYKKQQNKDWREQTDQREQKSGFKNTPVVRGKNYSWMHKPRKGATFLHYVIPLFNSELKGLLLEGKR